MTLDGTFEEAIEAPANSGNQPDRRIAIEATLAECINYASWQNSVPLLQALVVSNPTDETLTDVRLELEVVPGFVRPKRWLIDRIAPGGSVAVRDRDVELDPAYLLGLNEAERGIATFRLFHADQLLAEASHDLRVLARDEWGGMGAMGGLLAAFVMPNDPALASVLKSAADVLHRHGHSSALDGYQSADPRRAYLLTAAIWSAVAERALTYANPPRSFERVGQKTRRPATVLSEQLATCLDSTLLFAAAIEAVGLNPVIVMLDGHCFAGAWLVEKTFNRLIESDCSEIRKAVAARELVTFETTLVTHRPPARFEDAVRTAAAATSEAGETQFIAAIDITRARMAQIRPLASHDSASTTTEPDAQPSGPLPLPAVPDFGSLAAAEAEEKPATPEGRIDRWQRKLLDLSLRNRLLNFKQTQQTVPFLCPDISRLEDLLAEGSKVRIVSLPEENPQGDRDAELHRQKTNQDLNLEFARQAMQRRELSCPLSSAELDSRLTTLYRKVRNDLAEGGSNTLFLAVGFLKWKRSADDKTSYRAPLLLVPTKLTRKSAVSPFYLEHHEDEVRFNATLVQLLKKDFGRDLSRFESSLPTDESGIDVPLVLDQIRREVRDIPGFEVVDEASLATFSFAKYLMWKDLVDRSEQLEKNRVVRHLIRDPDQPFDSAAGSIPRPEEVDRRFQPHEIFHPLAADSSQLAAVMAASQGQDFVLVGPPGTGKSQTIANMIAQCLATGKTVLFVAEKTAALEVVYRRLRAHGLGDCCLELHSSKAERRLFLDQLDAAWRNNRRRHGSDWLTISERLKIRRDELNAYVEAIHQVHPNGWTAYKAYGVCVKGRELETPQLHWPETVQHDAAAYETLCRLVSEVAVTYAALDPAAPLPRVNTPRWSAAWEAALLSRCDELKTAALKLQQNLNAFATELGIAGKGTGSQTELNLLSGLAKALLACAGEDMSLLFHKQFNKFPAAVTDLRAAISNYEQARTAAAADYGDELDRIAVDELEQQWRQANAAFWPFSWMGRRKLTRLLQTYATSGDANPASDLAAIRTMQQQIQAIDQNPLAGQTRHWRRNQTDAAALEAYLRKASALRRAIIAIGQPLAATPQLSKALLPAVRGTSADLPVYRVAAELLQTLTDFEAAAVSYADAAGARPFDPDQDAIIDAALATVEQVQTRRTQLQRWTAWCDVTRRAEVAGLTPLVAALESGRFEPDQLGECFRLAYARWWLPAAIDRNPILRTFQRFRHEEAIADFRRLDELAREMASAKVKEAVSHQLPAPEGVPRRSELGLLRHQIELKRPSRSIRSMIAAMPDSFSKLAPCLLMSPLSIAQYLPVEQAQFDVVIFDEASQITTWDAIGAIARGRQTIIVGDPKQLPPTNFFGRAESDENEEEIEDHEKDLESILDEAKASGLPTLQLNWHYRSRHESLIAFSNWHYYGNQLVTFPAAESLDRGVVFRHLPDAVYDRGKSRTNRKEAEAIVSDLVAKMKRCLALPEKDRLTFGVVTFNIQQQSLIQDLLDQAQRDAPELEWYFADERIEPTMVKNLENVQGDERDVMFFSITFGADPSGKIPLNFGALNRDGGERRLNVAVTRARQELRVYASFKADQLNAERSQAQGVRHLKHFLEYAEKGPEAIAAQTEGSLGGFDSPFEEAVCSALEAKGWQVVSQVGVSGFRVDLGIVHPDKPGAYLAGVECDGATYHRSAIARDRDKTRQQVLENLGWKIIRIWSPDWWYDSAAALQSVDEQLRELLRHNRLQIDFTTSDATPANQAESPQTLAESVSEFDTAGSESVSGQRDGAGEVEEAQVLFRRVRLPAGVDPQTRFYDSDYSDDLRAIIRDVLEQQAPIRDDVLVKQVARAHGFARTGATIRKRILDLLGEVPVSEESAGRFFWTSEGPEAVVPFRHPQSPEDRRSLEEIPLAELRGLLQSNPSLLEADDPITAVARHIGVGRLNRSARARIAEAITGSA